MDSQKDVKEVQKQAIEKLRLHFVFNTLNAARFMIKKQPDVASDMLYDLAKFMRGSCDAIVCDNMEPLFRELEFVKAYLFLEEKQRSKMKVLWQVEDESGFIAPGSIYWEAEKLLKEEIYGNREERTIIVKRDDSMSPILIQIKENGVGREIMVSDKDEKNEIEDKDE